MFNFTSRFISFRYEMLTTSEQNVCFCIVLLDKNTSLLYFRNRQEDFELLYQTKTTIGYFLPLLHTNIKLVRTKNVKAIIKDCGRSIY